MLILSEFLEKQILVYYLMLDQLEKLVIWLILHMRYQLIQTTPIEGQSQDQLLHCLKNDSEGGLSTLTDGFAIANFMRKNIQNISNF